VAKRPFSALWAGGKDKVVETPDYSGMNTKNKDGSFMTMTEFAEASGLPFDESKGTPKVEEAGDKFKVGWDYDETTGEVFTAAIVPSTIDSPIDYLSDGDAAPHLDPLNAKHEDIIKHARRLYDNEGIVSNTINALIDNAVTDKPYISNVKAPELELLLNAWIKDVNYMTEEPYEKAAGSKLKTRAIRPIGGIEGIFQQAIQSLLVDGDWVNTELWRNVEVPEAAGSFELPIKITTHNVENLKFSEDAAALGLDIITYKIPEGIVNAVKGGGEQTEEQKLLKESTPEWMQKAIKKNITDVPLPGEFTTHIKRKGLDYEINGRSYVRPFFSPIADKIRLRNLDRATIVGIIQRITILMLGQPDPKSKFHQASVKRFRLFRTMLANMKTMQMLLWGGPADITPLDIGPESKILSLKDRYSEVDADLSIASGIPRLLIDGTSSGTSARDFSAFVSTVGKLEVIRRQLKTWVDRKLREIAVENGFEEEFPVLNFRLLNLRDEKAFKSLIIKAFETSLLGRRRALNEIGWNDQEIIDEQLEEAAEKLNETILPPSVAWGTTAEGNPTKPNNDKSPGRPATAESVLKAMAEDDTMTMEDFAGKMFDMFDSVFTSGLGNLESTLTARLDETTEAIDAIKSKVEENGNNLQM